MFQERLLDADRASRENTGTEEASVTLQIAMIGRDGWVIASDKCRTLALRTRVGSLTRKIVLQDTEEPEFAYAFAGEDCAILTGIELQRRFGNVPLDNMDSLRSTLQTLGNESWAKARVNALSGDSAAYPPHADRMNSLLIGFASGKFPLWELRIGKDCSIAYDVASKAVIAGDQTSPALFFSERYYDPILPVGTLMSLAAHVILTGAKFSEYVRDLEMVVCVDKKLTFYPSGCDKLRDLATASNRLDENIRAALTPKEPSKWRQSRRSPASRRAQRPKS